VSPSLALLALVLAAAQPSLDAARTTVAPVVDGRLDDPAWANAPVSDVFTQHFPDEGASPTERTIVRVLYDDLNLYVGIDCEQIHSPIVRRLMRRDGQLPSDGVWIDIDSRRSGVGAFHFSANAAGVLSDGIHFNDVEYSSDWDAVWEAKVADTGRGYSVEFRIPLSALRFSALPIQDWGFQVRRFIDARQEHDDWAFYPRSAGSYVPLFGRLTNLVGLEPRRRFELRPFVLGRGTHRAAGADATLEQGWSAGASAGLDAKVHVTNEMTLDLAINPDFGQVEADTVILNLSTFETFYPEKRPFFLEGIDTFAAVRPILYTRRLGRQPPLPSLAPDEQLVENPDPVPIFTAAKLVGTIGGRTTVGLISALTGPRQVDVQNLTTGVRERRLIEPMSLYSVARLKRLVAPNTEVGLLATATNRLETPGTAGAPCPLRNAVAAADGRCTNDAYVVTTDGRWRSSSGNYGAAWQAVATTIRSGPVRTQRDGIPIQPGTISGGSSLYVGKDGGAWLWNAWQYLSGRQHEFNDVGYLERKNDYQGYLTLAYRTLYPWWNTVETRTSLQVNQRRTLDGLNLWNELKLAFSANLSSFWSFYFNAHLRGAFYDDRETGDGTALERQARAGVSGDFSSDPRRRVTAWLSWTVDVKQGSGILFSADGRLTLRALPQLEFDLLPTARYETGTPRYVATDATAMLYQFGTQSAASVGATLRAAYTFTPELTLQLYTQLFLARVRYGPFFVYPVGPGQRIPLDALMPLDPSVTPPSADTTTATLNVNVVLRWEYRLGSTLFLVYTRSQNPALTPAPGGAGFEVRPLWQGRAAVDALMLKIAYWWG
jgi:hypothetical protein